MNFTTAPLSWHWGIIFLVCVTGAIAVGRGSRWYSYFWWPLLTFGGICSFTLFKSWGAGPKDGPSGLVILFAVLPVTIVSILGVITGIICLRKHPVQDAAKPIPMSCGIAISALALLLTSHSEMRPLRVRVLDGDGKPVSGITVDVRASDSMTRKTSKQAITNSNGVAHFRFWRFRHIEVSATARGCHVTRATYGETGWGVKGWKISAGYPQSDPTTVDLHLRGVDDFVLPDVRKRLVEFLLNPQANDARYALAGLGASFENFEIMDEIKENTALHGSYATFLQKQAELLTRCFKALDSKLPRGERRFVSFEDDSLRPSGWNGLARWAGIAGDDIPITPESLRVVDQHLLHMTEMLLDEAKPMLGEENSTAGTYSELRYIAKHRLNDLIYAYRNATPRAKSVILNALENLKAGYGDLESLIEHAEPLEALALLRCVGKWKDRTEFERAKHSFEKLDSQPHPKPEANAPFDYVEQAYQSTRVFFEEEEKRWAEPHKNR
jgi:hypothetical protein